MKISVVIPAYNEEKYISRCLDSLVAQKTHYEFEVIVVDNNSSDRTDIFAQKYKSRLDLKIIKELHQGRGAARASGFAEARGDLILGTEADTQLPSDWIETLCNSLYSSSEIVAVSGPC